MTSDHPQAIHPLAQFAATVQWAHIPEPVRQKIEDLWIDWLGSVWAGQSARPVALLRQFALSQGPAQGACEVLGHSATTSPWAAAMANAAASHVSMEYGLLGPSFTVATACASSNHAMGLAFNMIRSGSATVMLTGGSESMLCFGGVKAWEGLRVMSKDACRPFSATRNGMVQGEGAGVYVFEDWEHAVARGADIIAEVVGFAMTADAQDILMPAAQGAERAIAGAMEDAGLNPEAVGYINAHGTGTAANDKTECAAVSHAFGHHADKLMMSSTKAMHGHVIGGTGAIELLACIMALRDGVIAPTIGYEEPDPECALDVVPNEAREAQVDAVLSNAFAFGGLNAVLALRRV